MNTSCFWDKLPGFDSSEHQNMCLFYFFGSQPKQLVEFSEIRHWTIDGLKNFVRISTSGKKKEEAELGVE